MELKEFVRDVLVQIAEGVRDADAAVSAAGGIASPASRFGPMAQVASRGIGDELASVPIQQR
jgi:hypothetical protein